MGQWDDNLDGAARDFAATETSPVRALAGPGTGKTFALMRRVMRILQDGADPRRMLVCTFTRTAATDLKGELGKLGAKGGDIVPAGTLHAFCFSLLQRAELLEITGRVPRTLLKFEERIMLEDLKKGTGDGVRSLTKRLLAFAADWARLQSEEPGWPSDTADQAFLRHLTAWLKFHEAMLIGELVPEALRFLRGNPSSDARPRLDHVLVDEYQDLNRAEQVLLDELAAVGTLTVIGDEDQAIYTKMRHAHPEGIADFGKEHPGTHDETFDHCRRCPKTIVEIANALIQNNGSRKPRQLVPMPGCPDGEVHIVQWSSPDEEADGIAGFIEGRIEGGEAEAGKVLVLATRRPFGYAIRDALKERGIPAFSFFTEQALEGNPLASGKYDAQEAFTLLTLLAKPDDRVALRSWCAFGSPSGRSGAWATVRTHCEGTGKTPRQALEELDSGTLKLTRTADLLNRYRALKGRFAELTDARGAELFDALFPGDQAWAEPIRALVEAEWPDEEDSSELYERLLRDITQPELPTDVDYVRVMSLHKSKGLTADLVVVAGCIQGLLPRRSDEGATLAEQQEELEEQRRLFYVALTRARETMMLSSVSSVPTADLHTMGGIVVRPGTATNVVASTFLDELGPSRPDTKPGTSLAAEPPDGVPEPSG